MQYVTAFIEALDAAAGRNVIDRIVAVMGGSLGGNTSLLLTDRYDPNARPYLRTIVSWSVTATAPTNYAGVVPGAWAAALTGTTDRRGQPGTARPPRHRSASTSRRCTTSRWGRTGCLRCCSRCCRSRRSRSCGTAAATWPAMDSIFSRGKTGRSHSRVSTATRSTLRLIRHWAVALDLEQINFSFQDRPPKAVPPRCPADAGRWRHDNFQPNAIYNSTIEVARAIRGTANGKAEFWLATGHSIHSERPHLFVREILYFLEHPDAGDSPNGTVVSTPPKADYSRRDA